MKTAWAGILAKKIFNGAKVLATGRKTELINGDIGGKKKPQMPDPQSILEQLRKRTPLIKEALRDKVIQTNNFIDYSSVQQG